MKSLFNGSDLNGVVHPKNIKYLRYVRFWLKIMGSWPSKMVGEESTAFMDFLPYFTFILPVFNSCLLLAFVINHIKIWDFLEMGQVYITTFMCMVSVARQFIPLRTRYAKLIGQFINEIHLFHHKHRSDYAMKMHLFLHKLSYLFTIYTIGVMLWGYTLYYIIPLYNNWIGGGYGSNVPANFSYEYAIYYEVPFDYLRDLKVHIAMYLYDLYTGIICTISFCINDLLLSLQMFHLWGHLKILINNLENFPRPLYRKDGPSQRFYDKYTTEELKDVSQRLKDIVGHHNLILRNMEDISETFGPAIAAYYMFHILSNCVLLLEISRLDPKALIRYGPLTLIIIQLQIQISAVFELISAMIGLGLAFRHKFTTYCGACSICLIYPNIFICYFQSEKLIRAAYSLPWECMNVQDRRTVQVILTLSQRPLGLKAIGMVEVGMKTTVTILKTTLSYYVMLRTTAVK